MAKKPTLGVSIVDILMILRVWFKTLEAGGYGMHLTQILAKYWLSISENQHLEVGTLPVQARPIAYGGVECSQTAHKIPPK
jgi:hypothetical protein